MIVRKKSGEIRLCVDFRCVNALSVRDSFPLVRVEEALQAVPAAVWFTCFDLVQGYLQLAMKEADIPKTAFRAGSSGLFEFTHMPFGLTNAGASSCRLMEMCIDDQQYVTLLFYLDICIFSITIDQMLDRIELVSSDLWISSFRSNQRNHSSSDKCDFLRSCSICKGYTTKSRKG